MVGSRAFHAGPGNADFRFLEVDPFPFESALLEGPKEEERPKSQRAPSDEPSWVGVDVQQQLADCARIGGGRVVLDLRCFEQPTQIGGDVPDGVVAESDSVPEDLAASLLRAAGSLEKALRFEFLQLHEQLGCRDLADRLIAELREDEGLQHPLRFLIGLDRALTPADLASERGKVVTGDLLERGGLRQFQRSLFRLALGARVLAVGDKSARGVPALASRRLRRRRGRPRGSACFPCRGTCSAASTIWSLWDAPTVEARDCPGACRLSPLDGPAGPERRSAW